MSFRTASSHLVLAPVRIGLTVTISVASLLAIFGAVRPDTMMSMIHSLLPM